MRHHGTVLLFDIDGTLLSTGGAGRRAMERAFERFAGRRDACEAFSFAGMTDRAIIRAGFEALGREVTEAAIDALLAIYVELLAEEMSGTGEARVHRGVLEALDAAARRSGCAIGLGTGNVRVGAQAKLTRVGIYDRFAFGGFGCDHERRDELLRIGAARGAATLGALPEACRVVVIGDTPKDIAAAQAIGAESIAVATGTYDTAALAACGPTHCFSDLGAKGVLEALLG
ncbi:haloacid dehalogenase [Sorangium cellulosum]|uniref:phosphoglycolate phosphatase n=1 Tax=Sorangium cellulosum TaxID=56 RepID=A0A2L0F0R8_SORCE|nr:HAD family hydrolase [Sorangium cellulosum]AUX45069.1 haloacid dehalogenase [Sorangium cellulosum]